MKTYLMSLALAVGLGLSASAHADSVKIGTLTCNEASGWGLILGSSRALHCTFEGNGKTERYHGSITKVGVDIGYKTAGVIIWGVLAPTDHVGSGALSGNYVGATASATAGVGAGANVLVGGFQKSITLQPLSVEGDKGLNIAGGVAGLTLTRHSK
jgi:hypothetical protein